MPFFGSRTIWFVNWYHVVREWINRDSRPVTRSGRAALTATEAEPYRLAPMARPPDAERRRHLLVAARRWLQANGAIGFSLRELARGIGETHRTLLHHFGSKEALFLQVLEESRLQDRPAMARKAAREASLSPTALLRREWAYLSSAEHDAALRLYFDVLSLTMRNPERFRIHPELLGADWIATTAHLAEQMGMPRAQARSLGTFVLAGVRGLLLDLLTSGDRKRVQRGFEDLCAAVEVRLATLPGRSPRPRRP
jgi:AcrR family transcriptional regulator